MLLEVVTRMLGARPARPGAASGRRRTARRPPRRGRRLRPGRPGRGKQARVLIVDDSEMTALLSRRSSGQGLRGPHRGHRGQGDEDHPEEADAAGPGAPGRADAQRERRAVLPLHQEQQPLHGHQGLLCSGENAEELQRICREAGADGYVPKDAVLGKVVAKELMPAGRGVAARASGAPRPPRAPCPRRRHRRPSPIFVAGQVALERERAPVAFVVTALFASAGFGCTSSADTRPAQSQGRLSVS